MLLVIHHQHDALSRSLWGEGRFVFFASAPSSNPPPPGGTPPAPSTPPAAGTPPSTPQSPNQAQPPGPNAPSGAPNAAPNVAPATVQHQTRTNANRTLNNDDNEEEAPPNPEEMHEIISGLLNRVTGMMTSINKVMQLLSRARNIEKADEAGKYWSKRYEELQGLLGTLKLAEETAASLKNWHVGSTPPGAFINWLEAYRAEREQNGQNPPVDPSIAAARNLVNASAGRTGGDPSQGLFPDATSDADWASYETLHNQSNKDLAIQQIGTAANIEQEMKVLGKFAKVLTKELDASGMGGTLEKTIEMLEGAIDKEGKPMEGSKSWLDFVELYSLNDIYQAGSGWWEAYKGAWNRGAQLRKGKLQHKLSGVLSVLPFGDIAEQESYQKLDGEHRDRRGKFKEQLTAEAPLFPHLFGPNKRFQQACAEKNPDNIMAIIEYAADHGWLYTLKDTQEVDGVKIKAILPAHWDERRRDIYIDNLISQDQSGLAKERENTKASVKTKYEAKSDFLKSEFDVYMRNINFGAAQGVMQAMYERAIDGDEGPHIAAHFYRILREEPGIRRYMSPIVIQDFARLSAGKGFFTMTNLWMDRGPLSKVSLNPERAVNMETSGILASTMDIAERKIMELSDAGLPQGDLDQYVARLLAGEVLMLDKGVLSIWDKEFIAYRSEDKNANFALMDAAGVKNTENDYFAGNSEVLMASKAFIVELFGTNTAGQWNHIDKTQNFAGRVLMKYKALSQAYQNTPFSDPSKNPAEIFRREVGKKIESGIKQHIERSSGITNYNIKIGNRDKGIKAIAALQALGFIDLNKMGETGRKHYEDITNGRNLDELRAKIMEM